MDAFKILMVVRIKLILKKSLYKVSALPVGLPKLTGWQADVVNDDAMNGRFVVFGGAGIIIGRGDEFCTLQYAIFDGEMCHDDDILRLFKIILAKLS